MKIDKIRHISILHRKTFLSRFLICTFLSLTWPVIGQPQDQDAAYYDDGIEGKTAPRTYESYSLFLICNHEWLLPKNQDKIDNLYAEFQAFGEAIGPKHVAIWFRKNPTEVDANQSKFYPNVNRSMFYCAKFELLPSKSPFVLLLTIHPDDIQPGSRYRRTAIELADAPASEITKLLSGLTDELIEIEMYKRNPKSWWTRYKFRRAFELVQKDLIEAGENINITFDLKFATVEIGGSGS